MSATARREKFRAVLASGECVHPGSVYAPVSARIVEDVGFEVGMLGGSVASMHVLGAPDLFVLTLTEFATLIRRICAAAGKLPVAVDADHGFGNALNVIRTVEEIENAGAAGLTIEDTDLPQRFGSPRQENLISVEEGAAKMRAALAARIDPSMVIVGRTTAPGLSGVDDAIRRCQAYEQAGVDALFIKGVRSRADLEAISAATTLPLMLDSSAKDLRDKAHLGRHRVRIALQGHLPYSAGIAAVYAATKALRDGAAPEDVHGVAPSGLMKQVTRSEAYDRVITDFLGG